MTVYTYLQKRSGITEKNYPSLPVGSEFCWIYQGSEDWFPLDGESCDVFGSKIEIEGQVKSPSVYPNGVPILDDGVILYWQRVE